MTHQERLVAHDHFVYLLTKEEFENPPSWLTDNFHIIEGGTHAGGSSRNKLIIFKDGTYLELFSWTSEPKEFLAWSDKPPGLIDFALTSLSPTTAQSNYVALSQALEGDGDSGLGVAFDHPRAGGRKRKDGVDVRWETTRAMTRTGPNTPDSSFFPTQRLDVPFYCHDITERTVRVPYDDESITNHPCGAVGVSDIEIVVPKSQFEHYSALYRAVLGTADTLTSNSSATKAVYLVPGPNPQAHTSTVSLIAADDSLEDRSDDSNKVWLHSRGIGIRSLLLHNTSDTNVTRERTALDEISGSLNTIFLTARSATG